MRLGKLSCFSGRVNYERPIEVDVLSGQQIHESRAQAGRGAEKTKLSVHVKMIFRHRTF